jgi:hypothetical protein
MGAASQNGFVAYMAFPRFKEDLVRNVRVNSTWVPERESYIYIRLRLSQTEGIVLSMV